MLDLNNLSTASNHNGGGLHFGLDGKLYISVGENATRTNSQTLSNLLGKVLRINADGTIPSDNPFFNTATGQNRAIWALGLRNPFTFAVQPGTGRIFINDVGETTFEEINDGRPGANYGWPDTEGPTTDPRFVPGIDMNTSTCHRSPWASESPANAKADNAAPSTSEKVSIFSPVMISEPTMAIAEMALVSDISGVWRSRETPRITSRPMKVASMNTNTIDQGSSLVIGRSARG